MAQLSYLDAQNLIENQVDESNFMKEKDLTQDEVTLMKEKLVMLRDIAKKRRKERSGCDLFDKN